MTLEEREKKKKWRDGRICQLVCASEVKDVLEERESRGGHGMVSNILNTLTSASVGLMEVPTCVKCVCVSLRRFIKPRAQDILFFFFPVCPNLWPKALHPQTEDVFGYVHQSGLCSDVRGCMCVCAIQMYVYNLVKKRTCLHSWIRQLSTVRMLKTGIWKTLVKLRMGR